MQAPNPNADIIHTSAVYFIDASGAERYLATPMVDHAANGTAYLPPAQIAAWAGGIARLAGDLARWAARQEPYSGYLRTNAILP